MLYVTAALPFLAFLYPHLTTPYFTSANALLLIVLQFFTYALPHLSLLYHYIATPYQTFTWLFQTLPCPCKALPTMPCSANAYALGHKALPLLYKGTALPSFA